MQPALPEPRSERPWRSWMPAGEPSRFWPYCSRSTSMASPVNASLRNSSLVPPTTDFVSAKAVGHNNGMSFPMSLRALLNKRDKGRVRRYAVWISTPTDRPRSIVQPGYWYDRLFGDRWGVATFFREMSGGRQLVEWQ